MALGTRAIFDEVRSLAFGGIGPTFVPIGTAFAHPVNMLAITNTTDVVLTISFANGIDNVIIPELTVRTWNFSSNRNSPSSELTLPIGTVVSVLGAPTSGAVYVEAVYST